ncbi:hypothetical protein IFM89_011945, partial [Coptis chinensis]
GHNLLVLARDLGNYVQLGTTIDDAIGEAYDKTARWLGLDMRKGGGSALEQLAREGNSQSIKFSVPMKQHKDCNFSYAGLKTQARLAIEAKNMPNSTMICSCKMGLHGEEVVSMTVEGPPPPGESRAKAVGAGGVMIGPGLGRAVGTGIPTAPLVQAQPGLSGPIRDIGGLAPGMMQPQISRPPIPNMIAPPMNYPRPPPGQMPPSYPGQQPQQMGRGPPPPMFRPGGPPRPFQMPPQQFGQWPMPPPQQMMREPPPSPRPGMQGQQPPRPGMPPPPGQGILVFRPGMPPPPPNQQQHQQ